jgi:hypothetical protein
MVSTCPSYSALAIHRWINVHTPSEESAFSLLNQITPFIFISGSTEFENKVKKVLQKTAKLASGFIILERLKKTNQKICIQESKKENYYDTKDNILYFAFGKTRTFSVGLNHNGQRELLKIRQVAIVVHEGLHAWHYRQDPRGTMNRHFTCSDLPAMKDREEELVVTGMQDGQIVDFCSENTVNVELGSLCRCSYHEAKYLPKNVSLTLCELIHLRVTDTIKKELKNYRLDQPEPSFNNQTPLDMAFYLYLMEQDIKKQIEWFEIIELLIQNNVKSQHALRLAVLSNSLRIVLMLLEAGVKPTEDILRAAEVESPDEKLIEYTMIAGWIACKTDICRAEPKIALALAAQNWQIKNALIKKYRSSRLNEAKEDILKIRKFLKVYTETT